MISPDNTAKEQQLSTVKKKILDELHCPLKDAATNLVFGKGNPDARILFIGEAPGRNEDLEGEPFVGAAGKQLDNLLNSIGLSISDVYIANILKYRPPNNRAPRPEEIQRHTPYLVEQISIIKPGIIVTLGNYATKFVLSNFKTEEMKTIMGITQLHGKPVRKNIEETEYTIIPMYHPAAMLYKRELQKVIEQDFKSVESLLKEKTSASTSS